MVASHLYTAGLPDPELVIRTSGELRLSNYLLWQVAYSEFYVTDTYWPDFDRWGLVDAILATRAATVGWWTEQDRGGLIVSDRPKASAPKAPAAKSGAAATSWLAGFITRAAAGIVYAVVFILCLVLGIVPTAIFVSVMSGLCCFEFFRMTKLDGKVANERLGIAAAVLFPLSALGDSLLLNALLFALMLAVGIWYVCSSRTRISDVAVTLMGPIYTGFMLSAIVLLRDAVPGFAGALLSVGVCASLWVSDSFAYIVGTVSASTRWFPRFLPKRAGRAFSAASWARFSSGSFCGQRISIS